MRIFFAVLFSVLLLAVCAVYAVSGVQFNRNCGGYLKRAADAITVELAVQELETAVGYLEAHGLTAGYTSILYRTPNQDLGFWYRNLRASLDELRGLPAEVTPLERSNMLMKLRETILYTDSYITKPPGISVHPYNRSLAGAFWASLVLAGLSWWSVVSAANKRRQYSPHY